MMDAQLRRRARARRADRGALGLRGDDLRTLWLRHRLLGRRGQGAARVGRVRRAARPPREDAVRRRPTRRASCSHRCATALRRERPGMIVAERGVVGGPPPRDLPEDEAAPPETLRRPRARRRAAGLRDLSPRACLRGRSSGDRGCVVREAIGTTPQATAEFWRYLLDIDWMSDREVPLAPPDHPLFLLLRLTRRAQYRWATASGYESSTSARAVGPRVRRGRPARARRARRDLRWNEGRWRLDGGTASARTPSPTSRSTSRCSAAAYLGAVSFTQLRDAGRVQELRDGAIRQADGLFAWRPLPWCLEIF